MKFPRCGPTCGALAAFLVGPRAPRRRSRRSPATTCPTRCGRPSRRRTPRRPSTPAPRRSRGRDRLRDREQGGRDRPGRAFPGRRRVDPGRGDRRPRRRPGTGAAGIAQRVPGQGGHARREDHARCHGALRIPGWRAETASRRSSSTAAAGRWSTRAARRSSSDGARRFRSKRASCPERNGSLAWTLIGNVQVESEIQAKGRALAAARAYGVRSAWARWQQTGVPVVPQRGQPSGGSRRRRIASARARRAAASFPWPSCTRRLA